MNLTKSLYRSIKPSAYQWTSYAAFSTLTKPDVTTHAFTKKDSSASIQKTVTETEKNIDLKISTRQFNLLKEEIFDPTQKSTYLTTQTLNSIIIKSIKKENVRFAQEIFHKMLDHNVNPDDVAYTNLIEELIAVNLEQDALSLYIHAYLNNVVLDLEIFLALVEKLKNEDKSFVRLAYKLLKANLTPSKILLETLGQIAERNRDSVFLEQIYEDAVNLGCGELELIKSRKKVRSTNKEHLQSLRKRKFNYNRKLSDILSTTSIQGPTKTKQKQFGSISKLIKTLRSEFDKSGSNGEFVPIYVVGLDGKTMGNTYDDQYLTDESDVDSEDAENMEAEDLDDESGEEASEPDTSDSDSDTENDR